MKDQSSSTTCMICGVILTVTILLQPVGACMRPAQPAQPTQPAKPENEDKQQNVTNTTTIPENPEYPCNKTQSIQKNCLNNGFCVYTINPKGSLYTTCRCEATHKGPQCEEFNRDRNQDEKDPVIASGTIAAIVVGLIVAVVIILLVVKLCRMKSPTERGNQRMMSERNAEHNGSNGTPNGTDQGHESTRTTDDSGEENSLLDSKNKNNNFEMNPV